MLNRPVKDVAEATCWSYKTYFVWSIHSLDRWNSRVVHFHCITVLINYLENYVSKSINRNQLLNSVLCKKVETTQVIFKVLMHGRRQELKFVGEKTFYILRDITHIKNLFTTFKVHNIQCSFTCFEKFRRSFKCPKGLKSLIFVSSIF